MLRMVEDAYWYQNMKIDTILYLRYCIIALLLVHTGIGGMPYFLANHLSCRR